ncbi:MAG TPA: glycosyltransferase family 2 protein [Candidatus Kapabacteria bacterium]|nr:glycosyltransferase family 2 protein [Candidatus Kapabacteria bacterium]
MKTKLAICYRIYPGVSKIPAIYSDNKLKMSELCLKSFVRALDGIDAKIWVILDNCGIEYSKMFEKYLSGFDYELINVNRAGNAKTFGMQIDILNSQDFSEYIYFAEDDYFYLEGAFNRTLDVLVNGVSDFATPYNHPEFDTKDLHSYIHNSYFSNSTEWLSVASTTMSFMTTKQRLKQYHKQFLSYTKLNFDASMWFSITKFNLWNPFKILKLSFTSKEYLKIFLKTFYFSPLAPFGKKALLVAPVHSLATHLDNRCLPADVDWQIEFTKLQDGI